MDGEFYQEMGKARCEQDGAPCVFVAGFTFYGFIDKDDDTLTRFTPREDEDHQPAVYCFVMPHDAFPLLEQGMNFTHAGLTYKVQQKAPIHLRGVIAQTRVVCDQIESD